MTKAVNRFLKCVPEESRVLLVTHPNPDPDAIASAFALRHLVKEKRNAAGTLAYWGVVGRKENAAMLDILEIEMVEIGGVDAGFFDRIVLVDSQPGQVGEPLGVVVHALQRLGDGDKVDFLADDRGRHNVLDFNSLLRLIGSAH